MSGLSSLMAPVGELMDFRVTPKNVLILFLVSGGAHFTRRIKLNAKDAGLYIYAPWDGDETQALFAYGRRATPRKIKLSGGRTLDWHPLARPFAVHANVALVRQLALATWGHDGFPPAQEEVQPLPEQHANAAD